MGIVSTKVRFLTPFIVVGFLIQAIGTFFVPPSELFTDILNSTAVSSRNMELISPYVGMTLVGLGFILSYLPILTELLNRAEFQFQDTSNITVYFHYHFCVLSRGRSRPTLDVVVVY